MGFLRKGGGPGTLGWWRKSGTTMHHLMPPQYSICRNIGYVSAKFLTESQALNPTP